MTLTEWFWLVAAKSEHTKAESEAMENASNPHYMPEKDWDALRKTHAEKVSENG